MDDDLSLLPRASFPRERAISEAVAAWLTAPVEILDTLWDPRTCPAVVLPRLAWAIGLGELWSDAWPEAKQRSVVAAWIGISRIRGTRDGYAGCLGIVDAALVDWIVPPAILAPRASRTAAERDAYQAQFPEVRVYAFPEARVRPGLLVPGRPWFGTLRFPQASTAVAQSHRADYVDGGTTTPITVDPPVGIADLAAGNFVLRVPSVGVRRLVPGRPWFGIARFPLASTATARVYRYCDGPARPDLLWPSAQPVSMEPTRVAQPHVLPRRLVAGRPWFGSRRVPLPSVADQYVYSSIRLFVPDRPVTRALARRPGWICGRGQLGQPRYTVTILADTTYRRPGRRFMPGKPLRGAVAAHDPTRIRDVCAALRAASLGRDKVLLRTGLYRPIGPQDGLLPSPTLLPGTIVRTN